MTPEQLPDIHRMIAGTAREFAAREVVPGIERLERKDWGFARNLLRRAGELGLLGVDAPEELGGVGLDRTASLVVSRYLSGSASFSAAVGAQMNLAIVPLLLFGTDEQKRRYLPGLISGELVGAYALSEAGSGSDALAAATMAARSSEGYALNGEKLWITNGGFADLFVVFAKLEGDGFSAFLVERGFPGVSTGAEERKMGLHGSSTTPLILQDARVPSSNLLGEPGKGHKVAFNVLNVGRFKLGAMCLGSAADAIGEAARYAAARRQFGRPISSFGAIKQKLGLMTARTYAMESLLYRVAGSIDAAAGGGSLSPAALPILEAFAADASMAKVAGSETLDFVLDENVQIHGGNGFVADYPAERRYRDARVNRIFEGTNEINRLLIAGMLARRAAKEGMAAAEEGDPRRELGAAVQRYQATSAAVIRMAVARFGDRIGEEQEVLLAIADIAIAASCAESAQRRALESAADAERGAFHKAAASVYITEASAGIEAAARRVLAAAADSRAAGEALAAVRPGPGEALLDTIGPCRALADETVRRGTYLFD